MMHTETNDIQTYVDTLIKAEDNTTNQLKKELEAYETKGIEAGKNLKINYHINVSRYQRSVPTDITYDNMLAELQKNDRTIENCFGFQDADRMMILIQNQRDLHCCFNEILAHGWKDVGFCTIAMNGKISAYSQIKFEEQAQPTEETINIKVAISRNDSAAFYTSIDPTMPLSQGYELFQKIVPGTSKLEFDDRDGDIIPLVDEDTWAYFIAESKILSAEGTLARLTCAK